MPILTDAAPVPGPRARTAAAALLLAVLAAGPAHAEEIVVRDLETCQTRTIQAKEIVSETWEQVTYRQDRGPDKTVPTVQVVEIRRDARGDKAVEQIETARSDLERGNYQDAISALEVVHGAGWRMNEEDGRPVYKPFTALDPEGRRSPDWKSEYSHFLYAQALYEAGRAKDDPELLQRALMAVDDVPVPGAEAGATSGGFLVRFEGGNSRFYPAAMALLGKIHVERGRLASGDEAEAHFAKARQAFESLRDQASRLSLGPEWIFEAAIGPARIEEAKGDFDAAIRGFNQASSAMRVRLENEEHRCLRLDLGRYFALALTEGAAVKLQQAEASNSAASLRALRDTIRATLLPEYLRQSLERVDDRVREAVLAGVRDPAVQALVHNVIGLAYLEEREYEPAVLAFKEVTVKHFAVPDQAARAYYYLVTAAEKAAEGAKPDARKMYEEIGRDAAAALRKDYGDSEWARRARD